MLWPVHQYLGQECSEASLDNVNIFFMGQFRAVTTRVQEVEQDVPLDYEGEMGCGCRLPGIRVQRVWGGILKWLFTRNRLSSSLPHTQQKQFHLILQQCLTIPMKALFLTAYKTMALREAWWLGFLRAIKYDGLLSGTEKESDALPCYLQKHKCYLLTAAACEKRLTSQIL